MADSLVSLEDILDRATDPTSSENNEILANNFCDQVNREFDGPHHAIKLIINKLQLHQEAISLQALTVVEHCVKNCGSSFHAEIGKYRFLNELIKLLSPKYDASITPQVVKDRVIQLMFGWYCGLPQEAKIGEAYKMLKQQGVITRDPVNLEKSIPTYSEQARHTVFQDEEKSELLSSLLKSTNPEDLQAANKLIKTMVRQEEERLEKVSQRVQELETVSNNVKLLTEMLALYSPSVSKCDKDLMKDLYESCVNMRPQLFRLASLSADDKDDCITEILQASDSLTRVIDEYQVKILGERKSLMQPTDSATDSNPTSNAVSEAGPSSPSLLDLGFDSFASAMPTTAAPPTQDSSAFSTVLNDELELLGLNEPTSAAPPTSQLNTQPMFPGPAAGLYNNQPQYHASTQAASWPSGFASTGHPQMAAFSQANLQQQPFMPGMYNQPGMIPRQPMNNAHVGQPQFPSALPTRNNVPTSNSVPQPASSKPATSPSGPFDKLSLLDFPSKPGPVADNSNGMGSKSSPAVPVSQSNASVKPEAEALKASLAVGSLLDIDDPFEIAAPPPPSSTMRNTPPPSVKQQEECSASPAGLILQGSTPPTSAPASSDTYSVPLECIQPLNSTPLNIVDVNGVKTVLHFAKDTRDTANPLVLVALLSTMSTNVTGVKNYTIQAAVPKNMRLKLQPPSSHELSPFSPLLPLPSITQVMLVANPSKDRIRIKFRITGQCGADNLVETKDIDDLKAS